jgi:hypothetical protein
MPEALSQHGCGSVTPFDGFVWLGGQGTSGSCNH